MRRQQHRRGMRAALRAAVSVSLAVLLTAGCAPPAERPAEAAPARDSRSLKGWLLVAAPQMPDPRFVETVIFVVDHDGGGAMGLVVNRVLGREPISKLFPNIGVAGGEPDAADAPLAVHYGGPVQPTRGFVLHSDDYASEATIPVTERVSVTANSEILAAIAAGTGPKQSLFAVGYAGWGPGQLESEIRRRDWVVVPADSRIVFGPDPGSKWHRAFARRGIEL